jgi:hypothetical protein
MSKGEKLKKVAGLPPILYAAPKEKHRVSLQEETQSLINKLHEYSMCGNTEALLSLIHTSVRSCEIIQTLYSRPNCRPIIELIARRQRLFASSFDMSIPSGLRDEPRNVECSGDNMRRKLTKLYQDTALLAVTGKTEFDFVRMLMEGFDSAVRFPERTLRHSARNVSTHNRAWQEMDWFIENHGVVPVKKSVRQRLLLPENSKNPKLWAEALVDWYAERHPWPFKDNTGKETTFYERGKSINAENASHHLPDPMHQAAFNRLASLRGETPNRKSKGNPKERSPWNALRAVVREKFEAAFREVKVESKRDL